MTNKVFLVQNPSFRDQSTGEWSPKYDVSAAETYGDVVTLFPPGNLPTDLGPPVARVKEVLKKHGFDPFRDYILALGDPVAIAAVVAVVARENNCLRVLKWDRRGKHYKPYTIWVVR